MKGYTTFDPTVKTIHITKYGIFEEEKSWNWENSNQLPRIGMIHSQVSPNICFDSINSNISAERESEAHIEIVYLLVLGCHTHKTMFYTFLTLEVCFLPSL